MNHHKKLKILMTVFGILFTQWSSAFDVTVLGGLNMASPSISVLGANATTTGSTGIALGALIDHNVIPLLLNVELGAFYQQDRFVVNGYTPVGSTNQMNNIRIPLLARFVMLPFVSAGFGPYYMFAMGDYSVGATSLSYSASPFSSSEFGLDGDLRVQFPILPTLGVVLDAQYLLGLSERGTTPTAVSYKTHDIQILAGINFIL